MSRYQDVDWSMRDAEIAKIVGVSNEAVRRERKRKNIPPSPTKYQHANRKQPRRVKGGKRGRPIRVDCSKINWSDRTAHIAKELGCDWTTAEYWRKKVGHPRSLGLADSLPHTETEERIKPMNKCQRCKSARVAFVQAHSRDCCSIQIGQEEHGGYAPTDMGIGGNDDVTFEYCLDCGQIQGAFPLPLTYLEQ